MKSSYLHLLSDHNHLLNLVGIYSDALMRKEEEVDMLSQRLMVTKDCLVSTQLALQDSEHSFWAARRLMDDSSMS